MPKNYLTVPHYQQSHDGDCLPTCAVMILRFLGINTKKSQLAELMRSRSIGTPARNVRYLESLGVSVIFGPTTLSQLRQYFLQGLPSIVFVSTEALPYHATPSFHAVIVVGITEENVYLNDPAFATAPHSVPMDYFMLAWSDFDYLHAIIKLTDK